MTTQTQTNWIVLIWARRLISTLVEHKKFLREMGIKVTLVELFEDSQYDNTE